MVSDYTINGRVLVLPIVGSGDSWTNYSTYKQLPKATGLFMAWSNTGVTLAGARGWAKCFGLLRQIAVEIFSERLPGWCKYRKRNEKPTI
jgi:hypothetical protein